jgi:hypothetical protein
MEAPSTTEQCFFCDEAIQAGAVVCPSCGRELHVSATTPVPVAPALLVVGDTKPVKLRPLPAHYLTRWQA